MNDDLISRNALLEEVNNFSTKITGHANVAAIAIMEETKKSIIRIIDEQPSACGVDAIIDTVKSGGVFGMDLEKFLMDVFEGIHNAGGCDATDNYGKGWDDTIAEMERQ